MKSFVEWIGYFSSRLIYDFKPFNQRKMVRFYRRFVQPGEVCFDIGAHTGSRTNEVENYKGRKSGDIYAVLKHIKTN